MSTSVSSQESKRDKRSRSRDRSKTKKYKKEKRDKKEKRRKREKRENEKKDKRRREKKRSRRSNSRSPRRRNRDNNRRPERNRRRQSRDRPRNRGNGRTAGPKFKFDSPPPELKIQAQNNKIEMRNLKLLAEMVPDLKTSNTTEIQQKLQMLRVIKQMQAENADNKLYVGNFGKDIPQERLVEALNQALKKLGVCKDPKIDPIINAFIDPEGQYAFIEFRNKEEAERGLALDNISLLGQPLRVGRFKSEKEFQEKGKHSNSSFLGLLGIGGLGGDHRILEKPFQICVPSRVLVLVDIITQDDIVIVEEFEDIIQDIKQQASKYGNVLSVASPVPPEGDKDCPGMGSVFIEYSAISSAQIARRELTRKLFRNKRVEAIYFPEHTLEKKSYRLNIGYLKQSLITSLC